MFSTLRTTGTKSILPQLRAASTQTQKRAGDISDAGLKGRLIRGHENAVRESWERLLRDLREEVPLIIESGSKAIPEIDFKNIDNAPEKFNSELKKKGVAVVRGVVPQQEALQWKEDLKEYIRLNPQTKGICPWSATPVQQLTFHSFSSRQAPSLRTLLV
jgi:hypothetical protein